MLEKEFKYYLDNQDELVKKHNGKYLVIKDNTIVETFKTEDDAFHSLNSVGVQLSNYELITLNSYGSFFPDFDNAPPEIYSWGCLISLFNHKEHKVHTKVHKDNNLFSNVLCSL